MRTQTEQLKLRLKYFLLAAIVFAISSLILIIVHYYLNRYKEKIISPLPVTEQSTITIRATTETFDPICWIPQKCKDSMTLKKGFALFNSYNIYSNDSICVCEIAPTKYQISTKIKFDQAVSPKDSTQNSPTPFKSIEFINGFKFENINDKANSETVGWDSCHIKSDTVSLLKLNIDKFNFNNCNISNLFLVNDTINNLNIHNSIINELSIRNSNDNYNSRSSNHEDSMRLFSPWKYIPTSNGYILSNDSIKQLNLINNDILFVGIKECKLESVIIDSLKTKGFWLKFSRDTISNIIVQNTLSTNILFDQCTFSEKIYARMSSNCNLVFNDCNFKTDTKLENLTTGNLYFNNCTNFEKPLQLIADSNVKTKLYFDYNTDLSKLLFFYDKNFEIIYRYESNDDNDKLYDRLLTKFKSEYKSEGIKRIKIEYTHYCYSRYWWKYPLWFIDWAWWNFGFSKERIIVWTLLLLIIFLFYNYNHWEKMSKTYNIFPNFKDWRKSSSKKYFFVFLYTVFIFFSLRIDLQSLKFDDKKSLAHFFIQYFSGLICLFFLFNAIFRIT